LGAVPGTTGMMASAAPERLGGAGDGVGAVVFPGPVCQEHQSAGVVDGRGGS
jgi:hypothetical protein